MAKISDLAAEREEIDRQIDKLEKRRANLSRRIIKLLEKSKKKSVVVEIDGQRVKITRAQGTEGVWNQAALRSWLRDNVSPEAFKLVFQKQEVFKPAALDKLRAEEEITTEDMEQLQEFYGVKEKAAYVLITLVRD